MTLMLNLRLFRSNNLHIKITLEVNSNINFIFFSREREKERDSKANLASELSTSFLKKINSKKIVRMIFYQIHLS